MIEEADRDGDGEICEDEFMRIMRKTNLFWSENGAFFSAKRDAITETWNNFAAKNKIYQSLYNLN